MSEVDCIKSEVWVVRNHDCKMDSQFVMQHCGFESSQVKLRQTEEHLKHQSQQLSACRRLIDQHEGRLEEASKDLRRSKRENADLCSTVDGTQIESGHMRYSSF